MTGRISARYPRHVRTFRFVRMVYGEPPRPHLPCGCWALRLPRLVEKTTIVQGVHMTRFSTERWAGIAGLGFPRDGVLGNGCGVGARAERPPAVRERRLPPLRLRCPRRDPADGRGGCCCAPARCAAPLARLVERRHRGTAPTGHRLRRFPV